MTDLATISPGQRVTFADDIATTSTGETVLVTGVCNGEPRCFGVVGDQPILWLPVFAKRDNGREATTIWVHEANVMAVEP